MDLLDIFSNLGTVSKTSKSSYRMRCPFHDDRTPSLYFDVVKGMWKCFGCGAKGNTRTLQKRLNLPTTRDTSFVSQTRIKSTVDTCATSTWKDMMQEVAFCSKKELLAPLNEAPRKYLRNRGLDPVWCASQGVGLCSLSGVWKFKNTNEWRNLDTSLKGMISFNLVDSSNEMIGFAGTSGQGVYKHLRNSAFFSKSRSVFRAGDGDILCVCEGFFDALSLAKCGFLAVCTMGNQWSKEQKKIVEQLRDQPARAREIWLCGDNDEAGDLANVRWGLDLNGAARVLKLCAKDPHDHIVAGHPLEACTFYDWMKSRKLSSTAEEMIGSHPLGGEIIQKWFLQEKISRFDPEQPCVESEHAMAENARIQLKQKLRAALDQAKKCSNMQEKKHFLSVWHSLKMEMKRLDGQTGFNGQKE